MARAGGRSLWHLRPRKIAGEPGAEAVPYARITIGEHEVIGVADEVQLRRLSRALEQLDRLLGGRHRIVRGVQEEQWPRRNTADDIIGAEVEHALRGLGRKRFNRIAGEIAA